MTEGEQVIKSLNIKRVAVNGEAVELDNGEGQLFISFPLSIFIIANQMLHFPNIITLRRNALQTTPAFSCWTSENGLPSVRCLCHGSFV